MDNLGKITIKTGLPPGALIHVGDRRAEKVRIRVMDYTATEYHEEEIQKIDECFKYRDTETVTWINIDGLHDIDLIKDVGDYFGLHPLLLEDVLNTGGRPKMEVFEDHLFIVMRMHGMNHEATNLVSEQISFVLGKNWVLSFQEAQGDVFDDFRRRVQDNKALARKYQADYLLYRLIDTVVDNYFTVLEHVSEAAEQLESDVIEDPDEESLERILQGRKRLLFLRRTIFPLREAVSMLEKEAGNLISKHTARYLRDVQDHVIQVTESIEILRDVANSIMELHMSGVSNRMNEVMKVLTIIATIFIPLTFIAGIYGMNFHNMPELTWPYGYYYALLAMLILVIGMLFYFRKKKWL